MAEIVYKTIFQFKRGTAEALYNANPILRVGEPGFEKDTGQLKIGNGTSTWRELKYFGGGYIVSQDGSIVIADDGSIQIAGFLSAQPGQVPRKTEDGTLEWYNPEVGNLYTSTGQHTDGAMTQKAVTDALDEKASVELDESEEMLIFA